MANNRESSQLPDAFSRIIQRVDFEMDEAEREERDHTGITISNVSDDDTVWIAGSGEIPTPDNVTAGYSQPEQERPRSTWDTFMNGFFGTP